MSVGRGRNCDIFAALGILLELPLGERWMLIPSFGGGYYDMDEGLDLGSEVEFKSALECAYRFGNEHRLGIGFGHISNGGIAERNPGTEMLFVTYSFPLRFR